MQECERSECAKVKKRAPAMKPEFKSGPERLEVARPGKGETQWLQNAIPARFRIDPDQIERTRSIAPAPALALSLHNPP
jgi:hypothetical protein